MSVLIKRIDSSSGGGSSKGYPPGNVTNVTIKGGNKKVTIKWTDPDDVVIGDKTLHVAAVHYLHGNLLH